ncbi:ABC superfamily ATP binding cassette transporter, membrane protein [Streptococcus sanguinis SK150]|uniref:ABC superfamily ATP binding cassette transporter, membrane protein n=1 Tax=Streptococcus sanguinis SK150 TaxID=888811 RepID=F0IJQ7_STRSA|nr:ABC transporter permease [Streptococcus sanguinis]EGD37328.1 ABC superfamily ATP binding cassette transporter, membrane protein [Streptococcus sanguinis SK150]MBF1707047.1 ABC transporter permease [Streptococcus sanguinis]MCY7041377.1 ABC transporter permease [Streptococcus sanguinis]RSI20863.1 Inner membrane ABC transporter permease protein YjfF [Streptococcus sanguinis]RSI35312.1 Inner membrane ABC transporter permease protein YjfF [Streptococcus sanguinis]
MILSIISQGLVWAVLGLGIFMTFRILGFPDMTTEGSFPLGGAVAVTLITKGVNPFLATAAAVLAGCAAGAVTGLLYTKGKIPTLLSGILVMTSCHSIMLMLMGRANLGLLGSSKIQDVLPFSGEVNDLLTGLIFVSLVIVALLFFLDTKLGQAYIATGDNPDMARSFGINTGRMELMGLILSNGLIALAGALIAQQEGYADVSRGIGVIVVGLASLIIGEVLFQSLTLAERLITIVVGAIAYQFLIWGVIALGFNTNYLRLYSAVILAVCLMIPTLKNKFFKGAKLSK